MMWGIIIVLVSLGGFNHFRAFGGYEHCCNGFQELVGGSELAVIGSCLQFWDNGIILRQILEI